MENLNVSKGNIKTGAIPSCSLPPVITCRPDAPCVKKCYACKICRLHKNARQAYENNFTLYKTDPEKYFNQLGAYFKLNAYFRMHVSGDIPDEKYFTMLCSAAAQNPHCKIMLFTKQFEIVNDYITNGGTIPENLIVIFSAWGKMLIPENPHGLPVANVIFKHDAPDPSWKICGGNCFECACRGVGCWELKKGENIAFYEH